MFSKTTFRKTSKFGYYVRFAPFFLEEKPLDIFVLYNKGISFPADSLSI